MGSITSEPWFGHVPHAAAVRPVDLRQAAKANNPSSTTLESLSGSAARFTLIRQQPFNGRPRSSMHMSVHLSGPG